MISIIVTVFNKEKFIQNTLDSIIGQRVAPSEVIIVNDGSTDRSFEIINELKMPSNFSVITTKNQGVSKARNLGLQIAKNPFVYFVDGDDVLEPKALEVFSNVIEEHPDCSLYAANRKNQSGEFKIKNISNKIFSFKEHLNHLIHFQNLCWTSAVVINRKLASKVLFNTKFSHGEDRDFFMNILKLGPGYWIDDVIATYISDPIGLSAKPIHIDDDLYWKRIKEHQHELDSYPYFYYLKYKIANVINNLKHSHYKNALSWIK
ncbi:glycosyltransferase family 2 protein [Candidatus Arcticimaribacter forsetii]|uniref:glycosyltransferase family 2 protein n=1 Tax=Candidatus Arcticimaribacter forsetii TaxID=2820661 RepID=UPI002077031F|nr:glycosyltransferase family 2 protein [Candidatus Arcticimaribacter forsetii]MDB2329284.1 glycosyltransferase family 2 protein [Flavobacteriaceae bacterium]MDB4674049.1 glycosyltransferase family 2 protein [Flavobacteriaceae bacterium]